LVSKKSGLWGDIAAGIVGGTVFILVYLYLRISLAISLGLTLIAYIGSIMVFTPSQKERRAGEIGMDTETLEFLTETIDDGIEKLKKIEGYAKKIQSPVVKAKISEIITIAGKIFDNLKKHPNDVRAARKFLSYYLGAIVKILERYIDISCVDFDCSETRDVSDKLENVMDVVKAAFEKQLARLLEDDIFDLETEISLLERTIKTEGL